MQKSYFFIWLLIVHDKNDDGKEKMINCYFYILLLFFKLISTLFQNFLNDKFVENGEIKKLTI